MTTAPDVTVELYVRGLAPRAGHERQTRVRTELRRLVDVERRQTGTLVEPEPEVVAPN